MGILDDRHRALEKEKETLEAQRTQFLNQSQPQPSNEPQKEGQQPQELAAREEVKHEEPPVQEAPGSLDEIDKTLAAVNKEIEEIEERLSELKHLPEEKGSVETLIEEAAEEQQEEHIKEVVSEFIRKAEESTSVDLQVAGKISEQARAFSEQTVSPDHSHLSAPESPNPLDHALMMMGAAINLFKARDEVAEVMTEPSRAVTTPVEGILEKALGAPKEPAEQKGDATPKESGAQLSARADATTAAFEAAREAAFQQKQAEPPMPAPSAEELAVFMPKPEQKLSSPEQIEVPAQQISAEPTRMPLQANRVVDGEAQEAYEKQVNELKEKQSGRNDALEKQLEQAQQAFDKRAERTGMGEEIRTKLQDELDIRFQQMRDAQLKIQEQAITLIVPPPSLT